MEDSKAKRKSWLHHLIDFEIPLKLRLVSKVVPIVVFLTALAVIYIAHKYWAEKSMLELTRLSKNIKDLKIEYISLKSDYMNKTKLSEIQKKSEYLGLKILTEPQKKMIVKKDEY